MSEFKEWYDNIPFFTRWWMTLTVAVSLLARFNILAPKYLVLDSYLLFYKFQIWRPFTALFFYPTSFQFLILLYFMYNYSSRLEAGTFAGKPADYLTLLLFNFFCCVSIGLFAGLPIIMNEMILSVLYVWCQLNKDVIVSFWFGTRFKAMYLPWVLAGFNIILGSGVMELLGIMVGHLSFFLIFKYPQEFGGPALLATPDFLRRIFPDSRVMGGFGAAPPRVNVQRGHSWGQGHTLGN